MAELEIIERRIEAMIFASGEPLDARKISEILELEQSIITSLVENIKDRYRNQKSPVEILYLDGAYQMSTLPEFSPYIQSALEVRKGASLSSAALEVLAVIAYNQPVTRAFVEEVRGVDCSGIIKSLVEKVLIEEAGRMNVPGKPIVYKTTPNFLRCFGLEDLDNLPTLPQTPEDTGDEPQLEGQIDFFQQEDD